MHVLAAALGRTVIFLLHAYAVLLTAATVMYSVRAILDVLNRNRFASVFHIVSMTERLHIRRISRKRDRYQLVMPTLTKHGRLRYHESWIESAGWLVSSWFPEDIVDIVTELRSQGVPIKRCIQEREYYATDSVNQAEPYCITKENMGAHMDATVYEKYKTDDPKQQIFNNPLLRLAVLWAVYTIVACVVSLIRLILT